MSIVNSMMTDMFEKIATAAAQLSRVNKKVTAVGAGRVWESCTVAAGSVAGTTVEQASCTMHQRKV
jgi:hypothetical protein